MDCDGDEEGNGDWDEGGGRAMATGMKKATVMVMRVVGNEEGNGNGGKSDGNEDEGGE